MTTGTINLAQGGHAVHFYRADGELADRAAAHLEEALGSDGVAIAIATEPHIQAIGRKLAAVGVDAQGAIEDGHLIVLDARATLGRVIAEGQVAREAFDREVGSTVRAAGERTSDVRAYGEMVDLLWQDGDITGALELERLWNELVAERQLALLCAYHSAAVAAPDHDDALRSVCQLHSSVSSAPGAHPTEIRGAGARQEDTREFEPEDDAPSAARRFVEDALRRWGFGGSAVDNAQLLISELVTNAVIHTRSPFSISIAPEPPKLRLAVHDQSHVVPPTEGRSLDAPRGGRGLLIVAALADDWGVVTTPRGKTVWAELSGR